MSEYTKGKLGTNDGIIWGERSRPSDGIHYAIAVCYKGDTEPKAGFVPEKQEAEANAAELVRRWNSHEALLEVCEKAHDALLALHVCDQDKEWADNLRAELKAAIAKDKEQGKWIKQEF